MSNARKELYEFDNFRLDVPERILWRAGERVPLSEKAFDTLVALVRRGNRLAGKDELLAEVWTDAIVEENNLDKNISILRRVLGERADKGKFIETVRGHGFRFVPSVQILISEIQGPNRVEPEIEPPALKNESENLNLQNETEIPGLKLPDDFQAQKPKLGTDQIPSYKSRIPNRRWFAVVTVLSVLALGAAGFYWQRENFKSASAMTPIKSIAVLPFKPLVAENRNEALELGIADALISNLSGGDGEIIAHSVSSIRRFNNLEQDALAAGRELGVDSVLEGNIQTAGDRIRISARLLRVSDGAHLWAEQFDEKFTDIFAVQDSISERVAAALKIRLGTAQKKRPTENVEAYQLYMKGRFHVHKAIKSEIETGILYFGQAIEADPKYALAYVGLADAYRAMSLAGEMPANEFFPKAKTAASRAIEIDDALAEAHAYLGHIMFWYDWDWAAAESRHKRALELDPNSADALQFYAHFLSNMGRHTEAIAKIKRARELDPLNLRLNALEGMFLLHAGQTDEALARLHKTLELDSNFRLAVMFSARAYSEKGMYPEAVAATEKAKELSVVSTETIAFGAYALAKSGKIAEARAALDELLELSKSRYVPPYNIALVYNALGETESALDYLEKGFAEKDVRMVFLKVEPKWNNLRTEPRFIDLMKRMNFQ
jgi:TolB-like protein/DNA-binding winged helix-turn-helix (wHTH) protein/Tfp pilus assembly protein PilF